MQPVRRDIVRQRQGERPEIGQVRIAGEEEGIAGRSEEAAVLARHAVRRTGDAQPVRQRHARRHVRRRSADGVQHGAGTGEVVGVRLAVGVRLIVRSGEGDVGTGDVVGEAMLHRTDDRQLVGQGRAARQQLAEADAGQGGRDGAEGTAHLGGAPGLGSHRSR